jgi:hypothetical protein
LAGEEDGHRRVGFRFGRKSFAQFRLTQRDSGYSENWGPPATMNAKHFSNLYKFAVFLEKIVAKTLQTSSENYES